MHVKEEYNYVRVKGNNSFQLRVAAITKIPNNILKLCAIAGKLFPKGN